MASVGRALDAALVREQEQAAALDECRRERGDQKLVGAMLDNTRLARDADKFYRWKDKIVETLRFMSNLSASGDYSQVIADMATELLADLGVE